MQNETTVREAFKRKKRKYIDLLPIGRPPPHWALEPREVTPKFGKFENWLEVTMFDAKQHS